MSFKYPAWCRPRPMSGRSRVCRTRPDRAALRSAEDARRRHDLPESELFVVPVQHGSVSPSNCTGGVEDRSGGRPEPGLSTFSVNAAVPEASPAPPMSPAHRAHIHDRDPQARPPPSTWIVPLRSPVTDGSRAIERR